MKSFYCNAARIASLLLAAAVVCSTIAFASSSALTDIEGHWGEKYILFAEAHDYVVGFPDKSFRPDEELTKGQFLSIAANLYKLGSSVSPSGHWAYLHFLAVQEEKAVPWEAQGIEDILDDPITREEMAYIIYNLGGFALLAGESLEFSDIGEVHHIYLNAVDALSSNGIIVGMGNGKFEPKGILTRAQACVISQKAYEYAYDDADPTEQPTDQPTEAPSEEPTEAPSEEPTEAPSEEPTEAPSEEPTEAPSEEPTEAPSEEPTEAPSEEPSETPAAFVKIVLKSGMTLQQVADEFAAANVTGVEILSYGVNVKHDSPLTITLEKGLSIRLETGAVRTAITSAIDVDVPAGVGFLVRVI
jgi:hypothetical protein